MDKFDIIYKKSNKNKCLTKKKQFKILIVDDDKYVGNALSQILSERGHSVMHLTEGTSCISKCQNNDFDIIFMDFHLTDMNGVAVVDILRDILNTSSLIFAFTGDDSGEAIEKFKEIGMSGAIIKPIDITIINKLMNTLESKKDIDTRVIKTVSKNLSLVKQNVIVF